MRNNLVVRGILTGLALSVLLVTGLGAGPASAHAALVGSDPADGATLAAAPTSITLEFNENVAQRAFVAIAAPDGSQVAVSDIRAGDRTVTAVIAVADQKGRYSASYRVVSADGHPVTGTLTYDVTAGRTVSQVEAPDDETFLHRHRSHLIWGILAAVVAIALLLAPLRRRDDADAA